MGSNWFSSWSLQTFLLLTKVQDGQSRDFNHLFLCKYSDNSKHYFANVE